MRSLRRPVLITVALSALGGWALEGVGCASKPPVPEPPQAEAEPAAKTEAAARTEPLANAEPAAEAAPATPATTAQPAPNAGVGRAILPARGQTAEERRVALDKRLNDSLGSFDAKLRIEQEKIAKERDARQSTVNTVSESGAAESGNTDTGIRTASGVSARDTGDSDGDHGNRRRGSSGTDRTAGGLKSDKSGGYTSAAGNGAVAKEIPDGNDDDIVARRLRKAAEQETDPELKDKLWKEYVEYKKNTQ